MKAILLILILLPSRVRGEIAVGIGNGLSYGVDSGGIYISPPGSGVSIPIDDLRPKAGRHNNARRNNDDYIEYEQPQPQEKVEAQIMPSVPSAPSVGKVHEMHRKECLMTSYRTDQHIRKYQIIPGCKPKKTDFHRTVVADAQGKGTRLRDLLVYYDR